MDWRRIQSEPKLADNKSDHFAKKDAPCGVQVAVTSAGTATEDPVVTPSASRKPSERFMRRALQAKSRVSNSERFRIDALKEKLNALVIETTNEPNVFNGYRPGHEALPG